MPKWGSRAGGGTARWGGEIQLTCRTCSRRFCARGFHNHARRTGHDAEPIAESRDAPLLEVGGDSEEAGDDEEEMPDMSDHSDSEDGAGASVCAYQLSN